MKKMVALLAGLMMMVAGSAMAYPIIDGDYWRNTDMTTATDGNIDMTSMLFTASDSFNGVFGLYSVNDITNPTVITSTLDIFTLPATLGYSSQTVYFKNTGSTVLASLNNNWLDTDNKDLGGNVFGFFYRNTAVTPNVTYYTDEALNAGSSYVISSFDGLSKAEFLIDTDLDGNGTRLVNVTDVAPVPEPGTIALLGAGLVGLGFYARRRKSL